MSIRIITGSTGTNHVTSQDDGSLNQVILGSKSVVLDIGEKMAATVVDNNTVRISDGDILLQGRHARIDAGTVEDMTIGTGTIEMNRNDLIVARYTLDTGTGFENIELVVLEGTETSGSASDPAYNTGNIRTGSSIVDFPLYRVRIEGINIVGLVRLFEISGGVSSSLIADAYLSTKSYGLGEYCIDNGVMWKSRTNNNIGNTPAEGTYWTRISIANDVSTLNQNLTTQDGEQFRYAKQDGVRGILVNEGGADTFYPFSSAKVYIGIFDTNISGNKYYIPVDDNVEIDQLCCYQYKNSTATVYDANYSLTQARRYYGSTATVYNIQNNTTADSIGKDSNGFYLYHTNIAGYPYRYFAIGHIK